MVFWDAIETADMSEDFCRLVTLPGADVGDDGAAAAAKPKPKMKVVKRKRTADGGDNDGADADPRARQFEIKHLREDSRAVQARENWGAARENVVSLTKTWERLAEAEPYGKMTKLFEDRLAAAIQQEEKWEQIVAAEFDEGGAQNNKKRSSTASAPHDADVLDLSAEAQAEAGEGTGM